eukprot:NODE_828_length_3870_cov_0.198091.p1 type:complete len:313 gc:universal NODE_828_length_3870_cov_0.198091:2981-2043(-)
MEQSCIWFQMVDSNGFPYHGMDLTSVTISNSKSIDDFRTRVFEKHFTCSQENELNSANLWVYSKGILKSDGSYEVIGDSKVSAFESVYGHGASDKPLMVVVHRETPQSLSKIDLDCASPKKMKQIADLQRFIFRTKDYSCLTLFQKDKLATYQHGNNSTLKIDDVITVFSVLENSQYAVRVVRIEKEKDFIILQSSEPLCDEDPVISLAYQGQCYIQLGFSATTQMVSPISVSEGVIASNNPNRISHILGSAGANPGDSGGGCFDKLTNRLLGINVGCDRVDLGMGDTIHSIVEKTSSGYSARSHIVPSNLF